ncbi:hypothetical protein AGMMS49992_30340 [Clostridia bacterium]|nr:hypothetical protein AGMMS49992_30340 [Clostridia bacterium]
MKLLELRKARSLSQRYVSEIAGISPNYYCQLEAGSKQNPSVNVLVGLARHGFTTREADIPYV